MLRLRSRLWQPDVQSIAFHGRGIATLGSLKCQPRLGNQSCGWHSTRKTTLLELVAVAQHATPRSLCHRQQHHRYISSSHDIERLHWTRGVQVCEPRAICVCYLQAVPKSSAGAFSSRCVALVGGFVRHLKISLVRPRTA